MSSYNLHPAVNELLEHADEVYFVKCVAPENEQISLSTVAK